MFAIPQSEPDVVPRGLPELLKLREHALAEAGGWRLALEKERGWLGGKPVASVARSLDEALSAAAKRRAPGDAIAWKWLRENGRVLRTALKETRTTARESMREHPHVHLESGGTVPRAYAVATAFLNAVGYVFDEQALVAYLNAVQEFDQLEMGEIWAVKPMLQLVLLEKVAAAAEALLAGGTGEEAPAAGLPRYIPSLRGIGEAEWKDLFEQVSIVDRILAQDPAEAYSRMDYESRDMYRRVVAELSSHSLKPEHCVAEEAVKLAQEEVTRAAAVTAHDPWSQRRQHIGYYLIDRGLPLLRHRIGYRPPLLGRFTDVILRNPNGFYLVGIELTTFAIVAILLSGLGTLTPRSVGLLLLLIPATQAAVEWMNNVVSFFLKARPLPKLDLSEGIPDEFATMVAVPTLLLNEKQVRGLADDLEIRYLANRHQNLTFALVTDGPDSSQPFDDRDDLVVLAADLIRDLNRRYGVAGQGPFYLFHRHRVYNPSENTWMGWERKRGKLLDLNRLLRNDYDSFPVKVGNIAALPRVKYVITLDSDTQLPRDSAAQLVGAMAHPLNRAVIDPNTNTVVEGYGILQPRVGVSIQSASRSRLAAIYSGQTGFDIYTRAVSDVYQDLYAEGSFTGKGIYDVDALRAVLEHRFPCNALLSHDLIEGAYARAGLASDIEMIDDYPSHFSAYSRRKHRWVRGDWQITQWLKPQVPDFYDRMVANPTSLVSRWKIFDNLRRSVIEPSTLLLLAAGWFFLPGGPVYWTLATLALLLLPSWSQVGFSLVRIGSFRQLPAALREIAENFLKAQGSVLLSLVFLAHQSLLSLDAIIRTLIRSKITRRKLLEWETAAQAETGAGKRAVDLYLDLTPILSAVIGGLLAWLRPGALPVAAPILALWAFSKPISSFLNRPPRSNRQKLSQKDEAFLRAAALRTWRYFRQYSTASEHWLVPDNVQEDPELVVHKLSPTNLGLLLNARQAACEFGYITVAEFARETQATLIAAGRLPRFRGHFYNWYDTRNLEAIEPLFISTADNGNLAGALWALKQGALELLGKPLFGPPLWQGLCDHARLAASLAPEVAGKLPGRMAALGKDAGQWMRALESLEEEAAAAADGSSGEAAWWAGELRIRLRAIRAMAARLAVDDTTPGFAELTLASVDNAAAQVMRDELVSIADRADRLVEDMDFQLLYNRRRKLLSVGFDAGTGRLNKSCYDLLASEARMATFIAVAKGDIPREAWLHLGRTHTLHKGRRVLFSWTGTMFEYLMPALWMRSYPQTILDETLRAAVCAQQSYARRNHVPWGISEAAYSLTDDAGAYQYKAFGVPALALKPGQAGPLVVSPYSTFLALSIDTAGGVQNLRAMQKRGWLGAFGFYESVDFRPAAGSDGSVIVRSWMAHHQGMSLLAVCNLLKNCPFQCWFHAEPQVLSTELLLHEKVPRVAPVEHDRAPEAEVAETEVGVALAGTA